MIRGKKWMATAVSMSVVLVLLSACSGGKTAVDSPAQSSASTDPSKQPEVTLTVFSNVANYSGDQPGWFAKLIKEKFNIKLNIIGGGQGKEATLLASGDVGDIQVAINNKDAIKAGLLLDWNKNGLLDKYGQDIRKYAGKSLEAHSKQFGGGTAIYSVGNEVGNGSGPSEGADMTFGPNIRWDLYQKLGSPQIKTLDDYLPVLKQMQQLSPKSDTGKPTYGFSLWSDWDGSGSMNVGSIAALYGYRVGDGFNNKADMILTKADEAKWQGIIDDNGYYMKGVKFFFDANKMGLLDPDSLTQKFADVTNKYKDGQILFAQFPWVSSGFNIPNNTSAGKGFGFVPFGDEKQSSAGFKPEGSNYYWTIGAKTKYPERVMQFLNWLYTPEGIMESNYGPKGLIWDIKDGKSTLTDFGYKAIVNSVNMPDEYGGGLYKDGTNQINNSTISRSMNNPETGEPYDYTMWTSYLNHNPDPVTKSWRDAMGALTVKDYVVKHNQVAVAPAYNSSVAAVDQPADIKQKNSEVGKVIKEYSWKLMFAKNDNEFNSLKQQLITKAKGLGYDEVVKWQVDQYEKTVGAALKK
ncbi:MULTISPECIES: ABC transporter substrate-binding protein [unclassified Paenibacillus]|uniref:ABC transporter substrate-binding protein n=1 Tax=unclassified Paenibacillus TaxID=185978 RepID=UPI0027853E01|nr:MULTISPECIES: ABC transporter substrate-binding protein [unclassified Paenibacillus]MDQ0901106.1 putative aldouronate transport system substrate-binding protein [Paenibacillus sp. V4I7]MDQ0920396.1 putative aldouronate transport system substrate-binding protein [Paenibacillus sp. V4I5]